MLIISAKRPWAVYRENDVIGKKWFGVVTLFPEMFQAVSEYGITGRAIDRGLVAIDCWNPRDFATDRHRTVDDKPYGGGPGMLMKVQPLRDAIDAAKAAAPSQGRVIYLSPQGRRLNQSVVSELTDSDSLILVAGRYEGIDERVILSSVDEEISVGDFVVSGGELPSMLLIDAITRLIPGAVGDEESVVQDSFVNGLLDHPHYTRPEMIDAVTVPEVLLSGDHAAIAKWRRMQALGRTFERRPDLIETMSLTAEDQKLLEIYLSAK